ncbi:MAG: hypothetical protein ACXVEF_10790 [Polyangiales bacterium]
MRVSLLLLAACAGCASTETAPEAAPIDSTTAETTAVDASQEETTLVINLDPDALLPEIYVPEPWPGTLECDAGDEAATDADPKTRFCSIYFDLFGPTSVGKCQTQYCHGGPVGIVDLAMGWTGKSCYDALTTHLVKWIPPFHVVDAKPDGGDSNPTSVLPKIIDPDKDAGLLMPYLRDDNRHLNADERARISAWLARGAPFD